VKKIWILPVSLALVLAIAGLAGCSSGTTAPIEIEGFSINNQQEGIWINGQGVVTVTPDIATLSLGVEVQAESVTTAQEQAAIAMDEIMTALTDNGIAEKDIQTQYFSIYPVTRWDKDDEEQVIIGYRVSNTVNAKIREVDKVGTIIDAVAEAGGDFTRINGISFSVDDPSAYYEEARGKAMADAKAKAEQLAELAGGSLGKATYISESSYSYAPPSVYRGGVYEDAEMAVETSISPGETEISLSVQIAYTIQY